MTKNLIKILIIDDDKYFRMALKSLLSDYALIDEASTEAIANEKINNNYYDLAIIDMEIDGYESGIKILKLTKTKSIHSIILSSQNDDLLIEKAYEFGCHHFLGKIYYKEFLLPYIHKFIKKKFQNDINEFFKKDFITQDQILINDIKKLTDINLKYKTLFITGETGVGKSLIAKKIHEYTYDSNRPFVHINCSEFNESLLESELFGHAKGAFTGAVENKIGKIELAHGGTLFLDEVATMPLTMQQKLLKVLDSYSFTPVGSNETIRSEFTLICATCEDLDKKIENQEFREDLYFRISGLNLLISPLRSRKNDIPLLAKHFSKNSPRRFVLRPDAIEYLKSMTWKGNTRELKKTIDKLSTIDSGIITKEILLSTIPRCQKIKKADVLNNDQLEYIKTNGLRAYINLIEEHSVKEIFLSNNKKITKSIKDLQISSSAFYRIYNSLKSSSIL